MFLRNLRECRVDTLCIVWRLFRVLIHFGIGIRSEAALSEYDTQANK